MKNNLKKTKFIKLMEIFSVATATFSVAFVVFLLVKPQKVEENGQGGFETSTVPLTIETNLEVEETIPKITYQSYRVKEGDVISFIANDFGVTEDTIISVNNIHNSRRIQIGQFLKIPSIPGILYTVRKDGETIENIAQKFKVESEKICSVNEVSFDGSLTSGSMLFIPDAKLDWVTRQEINGDLFKKPIHAHWALSSAYGWRRSPFTDARSFHGGVDMACAHGTRIYAALPGRVTTASFNNTYGNYVIVTHHSGYKTLYAHMSEIKAKKGDYVSQNSLIGYVGSTGLSTGSHLHFSVFKNGKQVNPANLWN